MAKTRGARQKGQLPRPIGWMPIRVIASLHPHDSGASLSLSQRNLGLAESNRYKHYRMNGPLNPTVAEKYSNYQEAIYPKRLRQRSINKYSMISVVQRNTWTTRIPFQHKARTGNHTVQIGSVTELSKPSPGSSLGFREDAGGTS